MPEKITLGCDEVGGVGAAELDWSRLWHAPGLACRRICAEKARRQAAQLISGKLDESRVAATYYSVPLLKGITSRREALSHGAWLKGWRNLQSTF